MVSEKTVIPGNVPKHGHDRLLKLSQNGWSEIHRCKAICQGWPNTCMPQSKTLLNGQVSTAEPPSKAMIGQLSTLGSVHKCLKFKIGITDLDSQIVCNRSNRNPTALTMATWHFQKLSMSVPFDILGTLGSSFGSSHR